MSACTILGDKTVLGILENLDLAGTARFRDEIARCLISLRRHDEDQFQPDSAVITRPDGRKILFRPFTSAIGPGVKIIVDAISNAAVTNRDAVKAPPGARTDRPPGLHGIVVVCDVDGIPKGLINADEVTAYRTAMSVIIPFTWRDMVAQVVVFGAGNVARWLLRISLQLKNTHIKRITIVNRTLKNADRLASQTQSYAEQFPGSMVAVETLSTLQDDYDDRVQSVLASANVVFCTTPSSKALFPASYLQLKDNNRPCFVSGVGSWQPDMVEIDPELIIEASKTGIVLVDDRKEAMRSSGEFVRSALHSDQILELGEFVDEQQPSTVPDVPQSPSNLNEGLVVYKSIGVSLTDFATANQLLALAEEQGKGISLADF